ncbi:hypothetical protein HMPREF1869_00727 [Bacteroidales bacterium KA00251]|nr:hypothetical protein HMPREF1869_00727 [Bacteroidales bacterium KA00251]
MSKTASRYFLSSPYFPFDSRSNWVLPTSSSLLTIDHFLLNALPYYHLAARLFNIILW